MSKNLVLIGFMGVGKSTLARALCRKTGMFGVDSDHLIESLEHRDIKTIFNEDGEEYFRSLEKKTALWLSKNVTDTIISTGGGFFKVNELNSIGQVIYLKSSFEGIIKKLKSLPDSNAKFEKRPLLQDLEKAKALFFERVPQYEEKADLTIDVENKNLNEIIDNILEEIK